MGWEVEWKPYIFRRKYPCQERKRGADSLRWEEIWGEVLFSRESLEMATHFSILAWRILWTEESSGLQPTGSQRVGHDEVTKTFTFTFHREMASSRWTGEVEDGLSSDEAQVRWGWRRKARESWSRTNNSQAVLFTLKYLFIYLAALGLSCSTEGLYRCSMRHVVATCRI